MLERDKPDLVVAIGPLPMMNACVETTRPSGVKTMVSLNAIMVDGTGMCGSCRVTVGGEVKFACVDGPDFDGHQVDFKELHARQKRFKPEEGKANERFAHVCNLEKVALRRRASATTRSSRTSSRIQCRCRSATRRSARATSRRSTSATPWPTPSRRPSAASSAKSRRASPAARSASTFRASSASLLLRDLDGALATINEANLFPSICGRVCPQETQCEAQCVVIKHKQYEAGGDRPARAFRRR